MDEDERSLKRRRTIPTIASSASPPASDFQLQQEKAAQPSEEEIARRLVEQQEQAILKAEEARLKAEEAELEERHRTWNDFTDEYHDIVLELPLEYERNFTLLEELEETQQAATNQLHTSLQSHLQRLVDPTAPGTPNPNQPSAPPSYVDDEELNPVTRTVLASIAKSIRAAVRAGEDKVGLAVMMHESIDRHIRRLDSDLAKYEDSLVIGLRDDTLPAHDAPSLTANQPPGPTTLLGAIALGESSPFPKFSPPKSPPKVSRKLPPSPPRQSESLPVDKGKGRVSFDSVAVARSEVAERNRIRDRDAKRTKREQERQQKELLGEGSAKKGGSSGRREVERDSTRYCTCRRVSFGQMIGCENDACPFAWFHLECVNLSAPPIGKWYCATCCDKLGIIDQFAKLRKR